MHRRAFLSGLTGCLLAAGCAVQAQPAKVPRIGVLSPWGASLSPASQREPFERGLRELGWTPGSTIVIEQRFAVGKPEQLPALATELVQMKVDVIVAHGTAAIQAARQATSTIPIVMSAVGGDPVQEGLVRSLGRPGGNLTGLTLLAQGRLEPKQLELLKETVPGLTRVAILANRARNRATADEVSAAGLSLRLQLQIFEVSAAEDIPGAFEAMERSGVRAVLVSADPLVLDPYSPRSVALALKHRLPAIFPWPVIPAIHGG